MVALDEFTSQALGILTSSKLADALDISREDPKVVERYGPANANFVSDGAPRVTTNFLVARRLVEAGARYVTLNFSRWDWHGNNFGRARQDVPLLDQALTALVSDLHERGLDKDVSVVCWGEFGRTPKINDKAGRDHWPKANFAILAGGGMRNGRCLLKFKSNGRSTRVITFVPSERIFKQGNWYLKSAINCAPRRSASWPL